MKLKLSILFVFLVLTLGIVLFYNSDLRKVDSEELVLDNVEVVEKKILLPDLVITDPVDVGIRYEEGKKNLRFETSFANIGDVELLVRGDENIEKQVIVGKQSIITSTGEKRDEVIGEFIFHPIHEHWHIDGFARYQLWTVEGDQEKELVVSQDKVSFCLFDYKEYDLSIVNASQEKIYKDCDPDIQGVSVGWMDTYLSYFDGQYIDISDLDDGIYILKTIVNAERNILESNYENNESKLLIKISGDRLIKIDLSQLSSNDFMKRITKKKFGDYVDKDSSPIQPEKFEGFHTGVDYEFDDIDVDVPVYAVSDGVVVFKKWVSGYGGTVVVESLIDNRKVYLLYGHLLLESITNNEVVLKGDRLGILGHGYSYETDNARKHLHLAISKEKLDLRGYVIDKEELTDWIDPLKINGISRLVFTGEDLVNG